MDTLIQPINDGLPEKIERHRHYQNEGRRVIECSHGDFVAYKQVLACGDVVIGEVNSHEPIGDAQIGWPHLPNKKVDPITDYIIAAYNVARFMKWTPEQMEAMVAECGGTADEPV